MAITNYTAREVQFKVALYGPPFSGKTTVLNYLHQNLDGAQVGEIHTLQSAADKTLYFEFVPGGATLMDDFKIRIEIYTVPGEVSFNAPRKLMLRDVDGILFVADSNWERIEENVSNFKNLEENLKKLGADVNETPVVLLYNKRDLPDAASVSYLDFTLNNRKTRMHTFETAASTGQNVFPALRLLVEILLQRFFETNTGQPVGAQLGVTAEG